MKTEWRKMIGTISIFLIWGVVFVCCHFSSMFSFFQGCGIEYINGEWHRLFLGWVLHYNWFHLAVNIAALYFAGTYLEKIWGSKVFGIMAIVMACISEFLLSYFVFPKGEDIIGGSILVFACIGVILVLQFCSGKYERIRLNTWRGNWLLGYIILGNLPIIPLVQWGTVVTHLVSAFVGVVIGLVYLFVVKRLR